MYKLLIGVFFSLLLVPSVSSLINPNFKNLVVAKLGVKTEVSYTDDQVKERIRRSNPVWTKVLPLYGGVMYKLGESPNPQAVQIGKNGWAFLGNQHVNSYDQCFGRNVMNPEQTQAWLTEFNKIDSYLKGKKISFTFVVAPSSCTIYSENLPAWALDYKKNHVTNLEKLLLQKSDSMLDLRPTLIAHKDQGSVYSKLNSHWTDFGAYVAWQDIAAKLGRDKPTFKSYGLGDAARVEEYDGNNEYFNMANIKAKNNWARAILKTPYPLTERLDPSGNWMKMDQGQLTGLLDLPRITRTLESPNNMTALVLRDSMGDGLSAFIQASFKNVIQTHHYASNNGLNKFGLMGLVEEHRPDVVIFVVTERYLALPLQTDLP